MHTVASRQFTRPVFVALMEEIYARDLPEDSVAFWACLRRAFPDAMRDTRSAEYGSALANISLVYLAGTETAATSLGMTLAVLAAHPESLKSLEEVCIHRCAAIN